MGIWLSCGHREDNFDRHNAVTVKEWTVGEEGWKKSLSYKTVCEDCYKEYQKDGIVFYSDEEATKWLFSEGE